MAKDPYAAASGVEHVSLPIGNAPHKIGNRGSVDKRRWTEHDVPMGRVNATRISVCSDLVNLEGTGITHAVAERGEGRMGSSRIERRGSVAGSEG